MKIQFFPAKRWILDIYITTLTHDVFNGFQTKMKLQIQLERNKIISISSVLHSLRETPISICQLDLSNNKLTTLDFFNVYVDDFNCDSPRNVIYQPSIELKQNSLKCNCETINHLSPQDLQIDGNFHLI